MITKLLSIPFSFFRGTILNDYLNPSSKECPNPKAAAWLIKQDKTLWDTKLGKLGSERNASISKQKNLQTLKFMILNMLLTNPRHVYAKVFKYKQSI